MQLLVLHLKLLCGDELLDSAKKDKFGNEVSNVLFQITSCLRNMMNIRKSKDMFVQINGKRNIVDIISYNDLNDVMNLDIDNF